MDELFKIKIDVDTDGDFSYDKEAYAEERDFESFEEAHEHLINFLKNLTQTIDTHGRKPYVEKSVVSGVNKAIELYAESYDKEMDTNYLIANKIIDGTIHMGNQEIYWTIELVEVPRIQITSRASIRYDIRYKDNYGEENIFKNVQMTKEHNDRLKKLLEDIVNYEKG